MSAKNLVRYYNEILANYEKLIYQELINLLGPNFASGIKHAISKCNIVYKVSLDGLNYYQSNPEMNTKETEKALEYFEEKLGEKEQYAIGTSKGELTAEILERLNCEHYYFNLFDGHYVVIDILNSPYNTKSSDFIFLNSLVSTAIAYFRFHKILQDYDTVPEETLIESQLSFLTKISEEIKTNGFSVEVEKNLNALRELSKNTSKAEEERQKRRKYYYSFLIVKEFDDLISIAIANQVMKNLHNRNIYLFDNPNIPTNFKLEIEDAIKESIVAGDLSFAADPNLLSGLIDILPLYLTEPYTLLNIVGKENFEAFITAIKNNGSNELIYNIIARMYAEKQKNKKGSIVFLDTTKLYSVFKQFKDRNDLPEPVQPDAAPTVFPNNLDNNDGQIKR